MSKHHNKQKGDRAEATAAFYLKNQGFRILDTNFRWKGGEVDIVAKDTTGYLVFIEVKYRTTGHYGTPSEAVDGRKITKIRQTAQAYLHFKQLHEVDVRFDVIELTDCYDYSSTPEYKINHLYSAF